MKIAKAWLVGPDRNFLYGFMAITVSIFVFAYSSLIGPVSVLAYYALWLPLILVDYRHTLGNYAKFHWIIAFAVLACLSVFWSAAPGVTARASVQYLSHIVCALIAARTMNIRTLTNGVLAGVSLVLLYSLAFGGYHYDPIDGTYSFVGVFSSKNQVGFFSSLGIYFAFVCIVILQERGRWLMLALACAGLSGYALIASQSATSVISVAATIALVTCLSMVFLFSPRIRKTFFLAGGVLTIAVVFIAFSLGALDALLGAFGKDATLTGRTYLWSEGLAAAGQAPVFGVGYQAYWVQGFSEAERLWEEFYVGSRSGFHFHNTYIEALVELGVVGLALAALVLVRVAVGHLFRLLNRVYDPDSHILFGIGVLLLIRSFFEVDVLTPYGVGSFLLYYAAGRLVAPRVTRALPSRADASPASRLHHAA